MTKYSADMKSTQPASPPSATASDALKGLAILDTRAAEFPEILKSMLQADDLSDFFSALQRHEKMVFIDFLDRALDAVSTHVDLRRRCLRSLKRFSGLMLRLPSSYLIPEELVITGTSSSFTDGSVNTYLGFYQERRVAIKSLQVNSVDSLATCRKTFYKEVVTWKRLIHPHIQPFIGISTPASHLWIVSEWTEYGNIARYVESHPESNRLQLLLGVAKGLEYLHSSEVVHGDLKGLNVMMDEKCHARLADFGLASIMGGLVSHSASAHRNNNSSRWMAPELLDPKIPREKVRPTPASDVYSFAMVAIEVFSGNIPFYGCQDEVAVGRMLSGVRPQRPANYLELGLANEVWDMICACWHENPSQRPMMEEVVKCFDKAALSFVYPRVESVTSSVRLEESKLSPSTSWSPRTPAVRSHDLPQQDGAHGRLTPGNSTHDLSLRASGKPLTCPSPRTSNHMSSSTPNISLPPGNSYGTEPMIVNPAMHGKHGSDSSAGPYTMSENMSGTTLHGTSSISSWEKVPHSKESGDNTSRWKWLTCCYKWLTF